ncbi:MAG TPA: winged helix-turn-helix domain-containing protein [Pyrinomonadaceae bacterium]|jgi:DNA-binding winged helix-turn-helix (wHTH) protein/TolB-like protein/Tfp pilus assembly protein PilF
MNVHVKTVYEFGSFRLDPAQFVLLREGCVVPLTPKVFETLKILVENRGQIVEKDELLQKIWSDTIVEEASLAKNISVLRKVLSENGSGKSYIETVPKRGYRFTAPVRDAEIETAAEAPTETPAAPPQALTKKRFVWAAAFLLAFSILVFAGYWLRGDPAPTAAGAEKIKAIAILPFKPLDANEENSSLGLGMADALIIKLGQLDQVNVRPTSNIRQFASQPETDAIAAGKKLKVDIVLEGTIQRLEDRLRITAQLINVADGRQIWADKFEEKMNDFFVVQDAIAARVANSLIAQLTEAEREKLARRETNNPEAYRLYVLGCIWVDHETTEGYAKGIDYLKKAVELDPNFALAHAALSHTYSDGSESHLRPSEAMPNAKAHAERALELDQTLPWAHYQIAWVKMLHDWDWKGAESSFRRTIELDPQNARAHFGYGTYFALLGRREDALAELELAKKIRPLNIIGSNILYRVGEYDRALDEANKALEMNPKRISSLQWVAMSLERKGLHAEAVAAFDRARAVEDTPELKAFQAHTFALMGNRTEALRVIDELKAIPREQRYVSPFYIAVIYAGLGEKGAALDWLEKAFEERSWWIATLRTNPQLDSLRAEPRFQELLKRANL